MARTPKPMPLWMPIVAACCFAVAAVLQQDTLSTVLFAIAAAALALTAVIQWRMRQRRD